MSIKDQSKKKIFSIEKIKQDFKTIDYTSNSNILSLKKTMYLNHKRYLYDQSKSKINLSSSNISFKDTSILFYDKEFQNSIKLYPSCLLLSQNLTIDKIEQYMKSKISNMVFLQNQRSNCHKYNNFPDKSILQEYKGANTDIYSLLTEHGSYNYDMIEKYLSNKIFQNKSNTILFNFILNYDIHIYLSDNLKKLKADEQFKNFVTTFFNQISLNNSDINNVLKSLSIVELYRSLLYQGLKTISLKDLSDINKSEDSISDIISSLVNNHNSFYDNKASMLNTILNIEKVASSNIINLVEDPKIENDIIDDIKVIKEYSTFTSALSNKVKNDISIAHQITNYIELSSVIDLSHNTIDNDNFRFILPGLKFSTNLISFNLSFNNIGCEGCFELGKLLNYNGTLNNLDISSCGLNDLSISSLCIGIRDKVNSPITKLNLSSNNKITKKSSFNLAFLLKNLFKLEILNITNNDFPLLVFQYLNEIFKVETIPSSLKNLIAIKTGLTSQESIKFAEIINSDSYFSSLSKINLSSNDLNNPIFFQKLMNNNCLSEVIFANCKISDICMSSIIDLVMSTKIKSLSLYNNLLTNKESLLSLLSIFTSSEESNLNYVSKITTEIDNSTNLSDKDPENKIVQNSILNYLNLNNKPLLEEKNTDVEIDKSFIRTLPTIEISSFSLLEKLDISKNNITNLISEELFNIIKKLKLKSLDITQNYSIDQIGFDKSLYMRILAASKITSKRFDNKIYI